MRGPRKSPRQDAETIERSRARRRIEIRRNRKFQPQANENLESKVLLSGFYAFQDTNPLHAHATVSRGPANLAINRPAPTLAQMAALDNDGKVLRGVDRQGDQWVLVLHGPGSIVVTDVTPFDATFNDDIDTIQLVGTDPLRSHLNGYTTASSFVTTDGTVVFNRLVAENGVASIRLNGFNLARTRTDGAVLNDQPEIFLPGGVGHLEFNNILADIDTNFNRVIGRELLAKPFQIVVGDPNTPLSVQPSIVINHVFNSVYDSAYNALRVPTPRPPGANNLTIPAPPATPLTEPTVEIFVNGTIRSLDMVSATAAPIGDAGFQVQYPKVGTTGRTLVRANAVNSLHVRAESHNLALSRSDTPTANGFTGLARIGRARFGGNADGLTLDVNGPVGSLEFVRGLGSPVDNRINSPLSTERHARNFGIPDAVRGYPAATRVLDPAANTFITDPSSGNFGGLVTASQIGRLRVGPAQTEGFLGPDPNSYMLRNWGKLDYTPRPGNALSAAAILVQGSIGSVQLHGDSSNSEIQTGFDYQSFVNGVQPVRAASSIQRLHAGKGDLVDSVIASTYGPGPNNTFGQINLELPPDDEVGPGAITGQFRGRALTWAEPGKSPLPGTVLGREGAGIFAVVRQGRGFEPPPKPARVHGVLIR